MKQTLTNIKMMEMVHYLQPILSYRDKAGYVAARNYRILTDSLTEYIAFRDGLIKKYGEPNQENGTTSISVKSPNFAAFCEELEPFNNMAHEVELMTMKYKDAINVLTGEEILSIDWMLED